MVKFLLFLLQNKKKCYICNVIETHKIVELLKFRAMKTKKQFTEQVEAINNAFAKWFNGKAELVAMFNQMTAEQQNEFRTRMITIFATELANA